MQPQPTEDRIEQFKGFVSWVVFISRALAVSVEVFLHQGRTFGERYLGIRAFVALVIIFFYPIFWEGHDAQPLVWYLVSYIVMCGGARSAVAARRRRGEAAEHSYYTGRPRVMRFARGATEAQIKAVTEPFFVMIAGAIVWTMNAPLGSYLLLAGVGLRVSVNATLRQERSRVLDMNDALIDQRHITEQWRGGRRS